MFLSMTGFGRSEREFSWGKVAFEMTSVNHRYQEFVVKLPRELSSLENRMNSLMRSHINRGKVRLIGEISWNAGVNAPVFDEKSFTVLFRQLQAIAVKNNLRVPDDLTNFLLVPRMFELTDTCDAIIDAEAARVWDEIFLETLDALNEMRKSEGEKLFAAVSSELENFERIVKNLLERWQFTKETAIEDLRTRIENVMNTYKLGIDDARIAQEVALLSDKWDVSEEIVRTQAHISKFRETLLLNEPLGKKLDFLVQEINRELNTMGSKVNDAEFRWGIVDAKTSLEKIREQIQNVE